MSALRPALLPTAMAALVAASCGPGEEEPSIHVSGACGAAVAWAELPEEVRETSGVAASAAHPGVFWTHNDSQGDSAIFAVDSAGTLVGRVRVRDATNRDWEDIAVAPCTPGDQDSCVFIGDTGDNSEQRDQVAIYRLPEPDPRTDTVSAPADRLAATYPYGARDAEALFVTDAGLHLVTKGRSGSVELYRLPPPYDPARSRTLQRVQDLAPPPTSVSAQVTAATATRDGRTVAVRTYAGLRFFEPHADTLRPVGSPADFVGSAQPQGEGVDFIDHARLVLTGEAGGRNPATIAILRCDPRAEPPPTEP